MLLKSGVLVKRDTLSNNAATSWHAQIQCKNTLPSSLMQKLIAN